LRSGAEMLQKAEIFFGQGNLESAYVLYMKYLILFIEKLHEHPEYAKLTADEKNQLTLKVREVLAHTEELKKQLLKKFHDEREDYLKSLN
jgi:STAM-binding protein